MEQPPAPVIDSPPELPPEPMSLMGRLFNVLAAPGEVFDFVRGSPSSVANWLVPGLLVVIIGWVACSIILSQESLKHQLDEITDQGIQKQIEKQHLSKEEADRRIQASEKAAHITSSVAGYVGYVFIGFVLPFWGGFIIWLVGAQIMRAEVPYMKAVEVAGLCNMVSVVEAILKTLLILVTQNLFAAPSLGLLVKDFNPQNKVHSLLALVNIMTIWFLALRALGLAKLAQISFAKSAAWIFGIWLAITASFWGLSMALQAVVAKATGS